MEAYKRGGHTVWDCKYHLVWVTKYRFPVMGGGVGVGCANCYAKRRGPTRWRCTPGRSIAVHVHMLIGISPSLSVSRAVQYLKGNSSHKLLWEFNACKRYWGQHLWARGYWVATSGNVTSKYG